MIRTGKFIVHYDDEKDHRRIWRGGYRGAPHGNGESESMAEDNS